MNENLTQTYYWPRLESINNAIIQAFLMVTKIYLYIFKLFLFRRDKTMVAMLTAVVLMLVVCHAPRTVINLYESYNIGKESN